MESGIEKFFHLSAQNEKLTKQNVLLMSEISRLQEQLSEKKAARPDTSDTARKAILEQSEQALKGIKLIHAKVVQNTIGDKENFITIDKGEKDGVKEDMGIVCGEGIVGVVYLVGPHYAVAISALSTKSNISCMIAKRGYCGTLHWDGGDSKTAYMDDIPLHAHFKRGERIVTSGFSSIFPRGINVGKVTHIKMSDNGISYSATVRLDTDFSLLRNVMVVDNSTIRGRMQLLRAAQDSLKVEED